VDTAAALDRYTVEQIIGFARRLAPGLTDGDFADAAERLDHWGDGVFAPLSGTREDDESLGRPGHRDIAVDCSFDAHAERLRVDEHD
jgi:hypothetical protein